MKIWYSTEGSSRYSIEMSDQYNISRPMEQGEIVEVCAEDFHSERDGWECNWPRDFILYADEEGPPIAAFRVDREAVPQFYAFRNPA